MRFYKISLGIFICLFGFFYWPKDCIGTEQAAFAIIVDADRLEHHTEIQEIHARGNVKVTYQTTRLSCDLIKINTQTKDATARGNVRLEDPQGIIEAEELIYNFESKSGEIRKPRLRSAPYYYFGEDAQRISEDKYILKQSFFSGCNYDRPHLGIASEAVTIYPNERIIAESNIFFLGGIPFFYLPRYTHSLKTPQTKIQLNPGQSSRWGAYLLSAWGNDLSDNLRFRLYLDWRNKLGTAQGFGLNWQAINLGAGDFKFYYTQERPRDVDEELRHRYQRYLARFRYNWDITATTRLIAEFYRINDARRKRDAEADFLKDYFYREYERDREPKTYALLSHNFPHSGLNLLVDKRTNHWYGPTIERLPEVSYSLPHYCIKTGRFGLPLRLYLQNQTKFSNLTRSPSEPRQELARLDTYNQFTLPARITFLNLSAYAGMRNTYYSKGIDNESLSLRTLFNSGMDISTRIYRYFDLGRDVLGLDTNRLKHSIIPRVRYSYVHKPNVSPARLQEFDAVDLFDRDNRFNLELENKLQAQRQGKVVDLAKFSVSSDYLIYSKMEDAATGFSDLLFKLELAPYAWVRMKADATYSRRNEHFETANLDSWFDLGSGRRFGAGHRYQRGAGNELTSQLVWPINPKWKLRSYWRYQFVSSSDYRGGLQEQEYSVLRDLHCATIEFTFNRRKRLEEKPDTSVWAVFHLKVFNPGEFDYKQSYPFSRE